MELSDNVKIISVDPVASRKSDDFIQTGIGFELTGHASMLYITSIPDDNYNQHFHKVMVANNSYWQTMAQSPPIEVASGYILDQLNPVCIYNSRAWCYRTIDLQPSAREALALSYPGAFCVLMTNHSDHSVYVEAVFYLYRTLKEL